jgi:hypothetical protein
MLLHWLTSGSKLTRNVRRGVRVICLHHVARHSAPISDSGASAMNNLAGAAGPGPPSLAFKVPLTDPTNVQVLYRSSRNGTRSYGPSDSGRTSVLSRSERTGPRRRPAALDRLVTPVPFVSGRLNAYEARLISSSPRAPDVSVRPFISRLLLHLFSLFSVKLLGLFAVHLCFHAEKAVVLREA